MIKKDANCESMESSSSSSSRSSINDDSSSSLTISADNLRDDASSSSSSSASSHHSSAPCGPLYELADLMSQLPIKRGLSKYYHGKSQTFGSNLGTTVKSVEDLGKKEISSSSSSSSSYNRRMKSYNLNRRHKFGPKATIAKRSHKRPFSPSLPPANKGTTMLVNY